MMESVFITFTESKLIHDFEIGPGDGRVFARAKIWHDGGYWWEIYAKGGLDDWGCEETLPMAVNEVRNWVDVKFSPKDILSPSWEEMEELAELRAENNDG